MLRRTATADCPPQGGKLSPCTEPGIPAAATAVQSERTSSTHRYAASRDHSSITSSHGCADEEDCKRRLSVRNSRPWQTAFGGEPLFAWQIYRCGGVPSGNGSEGSVHGQDLSCAIIDLLARVRSGSCRRCWILDTGCELKHLASSIGFVCFRLWSYG